MWWTNFILSVTVSWYSFLISTSFYLLLIVCFVEALIYCHNRSQFDLEIPHCCWMIKKVYASNMCLQEEVIIGEDGSEETVSPLQPKCSFGEVSILCNIPQPYTVRVCELSRLLRLDKQSLTNILEIYFYDGRRILHNLLEASNQHFTQLRKNISKTSQSIHSNTLIVSERA